MTPDLKTQLEALMLKDGATRCDWFYANQPTVTLTAPVVVPPVVTTPKITRLAVAADKWFRQVEKGNVLIEGVAISNGGGLHCRTTGEVVLRNFYSEGVPSGEGMYFVIVATNPCKSFLWDNSGVKDKWIVGGNEAALRVMGDCQECTVIGVDICTRMHDDSDKGAGSINPHDWKKTKLLPPPTINPDGTLKHPAKLNDKLPSGGNAKWWKQCAQFRDIRKASVRQCRFIGLVDIGQQITPTSKQKVDYLIFEDCGFTDDPHFTDEKSYGTVIRKNCYQIDRSGAAVKDAQGNRVMLADKTWSGK